MIVCLGSKTLDSDPGHSFAFLFIMNDKIGKNADQRSEVTPDRNQIGLEQNSGGDIKYQDCQPYEFYLRVGRN